MNKIIQGEKKYQIIYADPPWRYDDRMKMKGIHGMIRGSESFYPTMSLEELSKLKIKDISSDNCFLFLWVTFPLLKEGLKIMEDWGFKYKTNAFTWIKTTSNNKFHFGMGHYTRGNAEICLLGVKGKLKIKNHSISQIVIYPLSRHSEKPKIVRDKIIELVGDLPRIELFARKPKGQLFEDKCWKGWDVWGNEVESNIKL